MFLHSGASLHGHEYSTARSSQQPPPARLLLRSALRHTTTPEPDMRPPVLRSNTTTPTPSERPSLPRPMSYHESPTPSPRTPRPRPNSTYIPKRELSVRFKEPETDDQVTPPEVPQSEDEGSVACSDLSDLSDSSITTKTRRRRKRAPRKSTQFLLAHPAPQLRTKQRRLVQLRPRLLLQLQELSDNRPVPAFDIIPSSLVAGSIIIPRLAMRCPRLFRAKPELGVNDLLVVRSEDYESPNYSDAEESLDQRDLLAVISPQPHLGDNGVEIVMVDGSTWESSLMANGSYEFIGVDERGGIRTARWVKKPISSLLRPQLFRSGTDTPPSSPAPLEYKWTFSIISPDSRRHPIMGSLISNNLEIFDTYNTMSSSSGRYPPTRPSLDTKGAPDWLSNYTAPKEARLTKPVPEDLKLLMLATAAWVNLRQEGWPATANPKLSRSLSQRRPSCGGQPRSQTFPARGGAPLASIPQKTPQTTTSPAFTIIETQTPDIPGRRRSISSSPGFVKRLIAPRTSMDGANRPTLESLCCNELEKVERVERVDKPTSRRLSVRSLTNKLFRRRSNSQAQQENIYGYKLDY